MGDITTIKGIEAGRADYAYNCVVKANTIEKKKEYKSYVKKIPMMIKTNGLGATIAFIYSKKDNDISKVGYAYELIYNDIYNWLSKKSDKKYIEKDKELIEEIVKKDSFEYRAITNEILALFNWLRRFAEGMIDE